MSHLRTNRLHNLALGRLWWTTSGLFWALGLDRRIDRRLLASSRIGRIRNTNCDLRRTLCLYNRATGWIRLGWTVGLDGWTDRLIYRTLGLCLRTFGRNLGTFGFCHRTESLSLRTLRLLQGALCVDRIGRADRLLCRTFCDFHRAFGLPHRTFRRNMDPGTLCRLLRTNRIDRICHTEGRNARATRLFFRTDC